MSNALEVSGSAAASESIAEAMRVARKSRWNPLRGFSGEVLGRALDAFAIGDYREGALLFETIADRDDTIPGVKAKREKAVAHKPFEVVSLEKSPAAEEQKALLERFWRRASWVSAWDRAKQGRLPRLIRAMQEAVSYRYSIHHIVWRVSRTGELSATFEQVPLWFFEAREAEMRFVKSGFGYAGESLNPDNWLISTGDGLMVPCSIGYAAKRLSMMDWLRFSEKFSIPGVLGKTAAQKGTPQGLAMQEAAASFANDWSGVVYGADGSESIELIQANGNPAAMPMPAMIEMVNRKFAAIYRGADLSTMSSGTGDGAGASLQGDEADILERDDAANRSEDLQRVERIVLEYTYGPGVEILAEGRLIVPEREDQRLLLDAVKTFVDLGARVSRSDAMSRFGLSEADADEAVFSPAPGGAGRSPLLSSEIGETESAENAARAGMAPDLAEDLLAAAGELVAMARREDSAALQQRLREVLAESNPALMTLRLQQLRRDLPNFLEGTPAMESAWERILYAAVSEGWAEQPRGDEATDTDA